jgi:hypothetical protein
MRGNQFKPLGRFGPDRARELIQEGMQRLDQEGKHSTRSEKRTKSRTKKSCFS